MMLNAFAAVQILTFRLALLAGPLLLALCSCTREDLIQTGIELLTGSYGVTYLNADDAATLDETVVLTADALVKVYGEDARKALEGIRIEVAEGALPQGLDGHISGNRIVIKAHSCPGNGSLAHELAHLGALRLTGDGDSGHHDTRLFLDDCKTNACAWGSVEMAARPLCD